MSLCHDMLPSTTCSPEWCCSQNITGLTYVPESNLWTVDAGCANLTALENITITLGFNKFTLRPDQYVLQVSHCNRH